MELDTLRRRAEDDKNHYRTKNIQFKAEIEDLIKENKKLNDEKASLNLRMSSLRTVNKQLDKKQQNLLQPIKSNQLYKQTEKEKNASRKWA